MLRTENGYVCVCFSSICIQNNRSLFGEISKVKRVTFSFLPQISFLACQSAEVGKMKLEQKTKLKLKTIDKID